MSDISAYDIAYRLINTGAHLDMAQEMAKYFINSGVHLDMAKEIANETNKQLEQKIQSLQAVVDAINNAPRVHHDGYEIIFTMEAWRKVIDAIAIANMEKEG